MLRYVIQTGDLMFETGSIKIQNINGHCWYSMPQHVYITIPLCQHLILLHLWGNTPFLSVPLQ